jgi:hypothetical protein
LRPAPLQRPAQEVFGAVSRTTACSQDLGQDDPPDLIEAWPPLCEERRLEDHHRAHQLGAGGREIEREAWPGQSAEERQQAALLTIESNLPEGAGQIAG